MQYLIKGIIGANMNNKTTESGIMQKVYKLYIWKIVYVHYVRYTLHCLLNIMGDGFSSRHIFSVFFILFVYFYIQ
jgi:hypothetical protein